MLSEKLINDGAFFSRPYGPWADMVYCRTTTYTAKLKELKQIFDPNNILNPGKLCH
jgi:FAD/FMN-containing dehydrogenase